MDDVVAYPQILSLCSGYGGLDLGVELLYPSARTVCHVEREGYAAAALVGRMVDEGLVEAPVWDDLHTFRGGPWREKVDLITAGYPCQPFSVAGRKRGVADGRHLWPGIERIIGEVEPSVCFFENVPNHLNIGFDEVARSLQGLGFTVAAALVSAEEIGASHKRERLFILAYTKSGQEWLLAEREQPDSAIRRDPQPGDHRAEALAHAPRNDRRSGLEEGNQEGHGGVPACRRP